MKLDTARALMSRGALHSARILPAAMGEGFELVFLPRHGQGEALELDRGGVRNFAAIDTAARTARDVGFLEIVIQFKAT